MIVQVKFTELSQNIYVKLANLSNVFSTNFGEIQTITEYLGEKYEGDYVVTPRVTEQTMETKDKVLTDNVVIKSIPFYNVSNASGGNTVYIGDKI